MKVFTIIVSVVGLALIGYNITMIDVEAPFQGQSIIAIITILASLCAIILLQILRLSKRVNEKLKQQS